MAIEYKYISIYRGRQARNTRTGVEGKIITGVFDKERGVCESVAVKGIHNGWDFTTENMTEEEFEKEWEVLNYALNDKGQKIEIGSVWFTPSRPSKWFPKDQSWVFVIENIGQFGLTMRYVNWKRNGRGSTTTWGINDLNTTRTDDSWVRPATEEEAAYFHKRTNDYYKTGRGAREWLEN